MSDLISSIKNNLKKIIPNAKDIFIKVERDHTQFLSKIHVQVPGKILHAEKKAETAWEAIDSSYQAVLKQVEKTKARFRTRRKIKKKIFQELLNSSTEGGTTEHS
jgi:ribosome-associated translation inhibitor RaiA